MSEEDINKIFRQLEERSKRANPYKFYDKDELIDEILKNKDEIERLHSIIKEVRNRTIEMMNNNSLDFMYRQAYKDILEILKDCDIE